MKKLILILIIIFSLYIFNCDDEDSQGINSVAVLSAGQSYSIIGGGQASCGLRIQATLSGASWDLSGIESVRIKIELSSGESYTAILYGGEISTEYRYNLYQVDDETTITITYNNTLSRTNNARIYLEAIECNCSDDPLLALYRKFAPVFQNRADVDYNDVPMQMLFDPTTDNEDNVTNMKYTLIYSHEDGGSGWFPTMLFGDNGRLTDVQSIFWVNDPYSESPELIYEGAIPSLHTKTPFEGDYIYDRPALRISTTNGLLIDELEDLTDNPLLSPDIINQDEVENWYSRELIHKYIDGIYRVMAQEAFREGTAVVDMTPTASEIGDIRRYLIILYEINEEGKFIVLDKDGNVLGESDTIADAAGGVPIWIDTFPAENELYLYLDGSETDPSWNAVGYYEDLLREVIISEECISGSITDESDPCRLW